MTTAVTPWWKALQVRREIVSASGQIDDVQMSLFQAVHGSGSERPPYSDASYYGEITHPTERLVDLLGEIAVRLGGGDDYLKARAVTRLDQGMGGGKSHACIGAFHLADNPSRLSRTELGRRVFDRCEQRIGRPLPEDLDRPHVVVLPCDNMTPGAPTQHLDGPAVNLYERFLWRLFGHDYSMYERYQPYFSDKSKIAEALKALNRPVLIIVDEILDYVGNGLDGSNSQELVGQDMAFLRALLDVVNDVPRAAMLVVMIASDQDTTALSQEAQARRDDLHSLLERNGLPATVTEVGDFASILRRRLFEADPPAEVLSATAQSFRTSLSDPAWSKHVWASMSSNWRDNWDSEVAACYPFHPMLMALAKDEWSRVTGFQRVRSTIRIFAATVFAQQQRGLAGEWVPTLIGPGDLPLSDNSVREAILGSGLVEDDRTTANYRSLAENEIVNASREGGTARRQDLDGGDDLWRSINPLAAERAATFIFLASVVGTLRPGKGRGASAPEVKAATSVPDVLYSLTDADGVLEALVDPERGMSALDVVPGQGNNKPARYFLSTRLTYRMLVSNIKRTVTDRDRDDAIASFAQRLANSGPFREIIFVQADPERSPRDVVMAAGIDTAHTNRLVVLDPAQFTLRNGMEEATMAALRVASGLGEGEDRLPIQWASSAVFAVANTRGRSNARALAVEYLARQRALAADEVQADPELKSTGSKELSAAKDQLEKAVRRAFQHVVYLVQPDVALPRDLDQLTFEDSSLTALDGTIVWKGLAERDKVFDVGQFSSAALLHNLRPEDYGRSLSEVRSAFFQAPRLPLLFGGDRDLQQAIYDAVATGEVSLVDASGAEVAITAPTQINLSSTSLRLAPAATPCPDCGLAPHDGPCVGSSESQPSPESGSTRRSATGERGGEEVSGDDRSGQPSVDRQLAFSFTGSLLADADSADSFAALFKAIYLSLDEREISYLQGTLQLVLNQSAVDALQERLADLGISASVKDL